MDVSNRVQVVPLGYEYDRVLEPIYRYRADTVVLFRHLSERDREADFQREVVQRLEENERIELDVRECDFFDIDRALEAFVSAIGEYEGDGDEVFVNVATGSKITAIAGAIACQSTSATPFYVTPGSRGEDDERAPPETPLTDSIADVTELPVFPLDGPSADQRAVLAYLRDHDGATKGELVEHARERGLAFAAASQSKSAEGLYRLLDAHVISSLTEAEFVRVERDGRTKRVYLTDRGRDALRVFPPSDDRR